MYISMFHGRYDAERTSFVETFADVCLGFACTNRHLSLGLNINILDHPAALQNMSFPNDAAQTCKDWNIWTATHDVNQTDSGP